MQIIYEDEYAVELFRTTKNQTPAAVGDIVFLEDEQWIVKSRIFYPEVDIVVVSVTQNVIKSSDKTEPDRLEEMRGTILSVAKKQALQDKKQRTLTEQIVSLRTYLKSQQRKP